MRVRVIKRYSECFKRRVVEDLEGTTDLERQDGDRMRYKRIYTVKARTGFNCGPG